MKQTPRKAAVTGEVKVVIVPPIGLKKSTFAVLQTVYNVAEQYKLNFSNLQFGNAQKKNLIVLNSFEGLPAQQQGVTFSYFLYGLKESTKPDDIAKNVYLIEDY